MPFSSCRVPSSLFQIYFTTLFIENYPPRSSHVKAYNSIFHFSSFMPRHDPSSVLDRHLALLFYPQFFFLLASGSSVLFPFPFPTHDVLLFNGTFQPPLTSSNFHDFANLFHGFFHSDVHPSNRCLSLPFGSPHPFFKSISRRSLLKIFLRVQATSKLTTIYLRFFISVHSCHGTTLRPSLIENLHFFSISNSFFSPRFRLFTSLSISTSHSL